MKKLTLTLAALVTTAVLVAAQEPTVRPEIRPFVGMYIPTGEQRNFFDDAATLQAALELRPSFHVLGTLGWAPGRTKYAVAKDNVQMLQYDVGLELNMVRQVRAGLGGFHSCHTN